MVIALNDKWIWDSWYVHDGACWHAFFLQAPKSLGDPELRHWNVSVGHAVSTDLRDWKHLGTCLEPSAGPGWDDYTTWTGSVVRGDDGFWHLFYTGTRRAEDGLRQRVFHAASEDLHDWRRSGDGPVLDLTEADADRYKVDHAVGVWHDRAFRDPWVMRDPGGPGWLMFLTARAAGVAEPNAGGAIALATSPDLRDWTLHPPVFTGHYGQLEVPQVFERGGRWYCLFCTAAEHFSKAAAEALPGGPVTGNHYLIADDPRGPWRVAPGFLDGALPPRRYAGRVLEHEGRLWMMGFADRPDGEGFVGQVMDPEEVLVGEDGLLRMAGDG